MRKKISKKLSFSEVNEMTIHEILKAMEITLGNDTDEKAMEDDCQSLPMSWEMKVKFDVPSTRQWTCLEKKLNFIILAYVAIRKYRGFYTDWDEFVQKFDNCRYVDTSIINKPYQTVCLGYDLDAFTRNTPLGWTYGKSGLKSIVVDYTNTNILDAPHHLFGVTMAGEMVTADFCKYRLANEIIMIRKNLEVSRFQLAQDWCKKVVNAINDSIYPVPGNSMGEFLTPVGQPIKRISVADYVVFLLIIKHVNNMDHNLVMRYLTPQGNNMEDAAARFAVLRAFETACPFGENNKFSICPQEHLLALSNYFKPEYVYDAENGDNTLESTINSGNYIRVD